MICGIKLVIGLVACLAIGNAARVPFPQDRVLTYKYVGDVKAGTIQPAAYASEFGISAYLHITPDNRDVDHPNTIIVVLENVQSGVYNGISSVEEPYEYSEDIPEAAKIIEQPFAIVYDDLGRLLGVRINEQEPGWSKNMKKAIASMFNVDMHQLDLQSLNKPKSFIANEITIYGNCSTNYQVHPVRDADYEFIITKFTSPKDCSDYKVWEFDYVEYGGCDLRSENSYDMGSGKIFKASKVGDNILIKSLTVYGNVNRFLWRGRSEAHYILNNATLILIENNEAPAEFNDFNLNNVALSTDISYGKLHDSYDEQAELDVTQGRHVLQRDTIVSRVLKMLGQAADYLEENHVIDDEPDYKQGHLMNRLSRLLKLMKVKYFHDVYDQIAERKTNRDDVIKRIFLELIATVGTHASTLFIRDLVIEDKLHYLMMLELLGKMPLNVRNPDVALLHELEPMLQKNYSLSMKKDDNDDDDKVVPRILEDIAKPVFLSFATLVYRAHKNYPPEKLQQAALLNTYIDFFYDYFLRAEYDGKVTALQALRNIQVGKVYELLVPIVKGEIEMEDFTEELRLHAIWAVDKAIPDYHHAYDLLWSIMTDYNRPLKVRIAAYDILIRKTVTTANMLQIYWYMVYEKNEQFYNYHYTTLKGLANSVDPCNAYLRELATHILRFTKICPQPFYGMSSSYMFDSIDPIYGHGEGFYVSYVAHEKTGFPEVLTIEHSIVEGRKRHTFWKLQIILKNIDMIMKVLTDALGMKFSLNNTDVLNVLKEAKGNYKSSNIFVDIVFSHNGRVTFADNYSSRDHPLSDVILELFFKFQAHDIRMNHQFVQHDNNDEVHLVGELGIPILITNKIPKVYSIKRHLRVLNSTHIEDESDFRIWRHGEYSMATYNPLFDTWHVVQRLTATDIQLPMKGIAVTHSSRSLAEGIIFRLPVNKYSIAGFMSHAKDSVDLIESEGPLLSKFCETCEKHEVVIIGKPYSVYDPETYDSRSLGLQFYSALFDCENGLSPVLLEKESWRTFMKERKNSWGDEIIDKILSIRQDFRNILLAPKLGSCGTITKVEPSKKYPTSYVHYLLKSNFDSIEEPHIMYALKGTKINIRGSYKTFRYSDNETVSTWDLHLDGIIKPGHQEQSVNLQLIRKVPGEKNLRVCIDAQKSYPSVPPTDPLKINANEEETHTKLTFSMSKSDGDQCSRDSTLIQINIKGQLSEEQKAQLIKDEEAGGCAANKHNALYANAQGFTPLTPKCLNHAIKYSTLRNYLINIHYAKIPDTLSEMLRSTVDEERIYLMPHLEYNKERTEEGTIKIAVNYSIDAATTDISVTTPTHGFNIYDLEVLDDDNNGNLFDPPRIDGFGSNPDKYLWSLLLDNSRFSIEFLAEYTQGKTKLCSIYPKVLITADGGELAHEISNKWTLASGDYVDEMYAVFVKSVNNVMGVKVFAKDSWIELAPLNNEYSIKVNGHEISPNSVTNGTYVPDDPQERWVLQMTSYGPATYIELKDRPVRVIYTLNNVAILLENELQGRIAGLCGHLDGTHKRTVPKEYYLIHV